MFFVPSYLFFFIQVFNVYFLSKQVHQTQYWILPPIMELMVKWRIKICKHIRSLKLAKREENYLESISLMFLTVINIGSRKTWCTGKRFSTLKIKWKFWKLNDTPKFQILESHFLQQNYLTLKICRIVVLKEHSRDLWRSLRYFSVGLLRSKLLS